MSIPAYWTRTSRKPIIVAGYEFLSYRVGINSYTLWCDTLQARVMRTYSDADTFVAMVKGNSILSSASGKAKRFRSEKTAIAAAIMAAGGAA